MTPLTATTPPPTDRPADAPGAAARSSLLASLVLSGMFAGFFFTYSASVVLGLARVDDVTYVRSFQAINDTIRNPAFAVVFFGTVPAAALALALHRHVDRTTRRLLATGLVLATAVVVITFTANVPLNDELATYADLDAESAAAARGDFESLWNLLNLVRTLCAVAATTAIAAASVTLRSSSDHT